MMGYNEEKHLRLSPSSEEWFAEFKNSWNSADKHSILKNLHQHLKSDPNPYEEAVRLMYKSPDFNNQKSKSMAFTIMKEFSYLAKVSAVKMRALLTPDIKIFAFDVVSKQKEFELFKLVATVYGMVADRHLFTEIIKKNIIGKKNYQEACKYSSFLGLHNDFGIDDFLVPLILQNKSGNSVEQFLTKVPQHQIAVLTFMDSILGTPPNFKSALQEYIKKHGLEDVELDKLDEKKWEKLMMDFLRKFKLSSDITPCLYKSKNRRALSHVLYLRFIDKCIDYEAWKEMIEEVVRRDDDLQEVLIRDIAGKYKTPAEALKWARFYNISKQTWPYSVQKLHDNPSNIRPEETIEQFDPDTKNCHTLNQHVSIVIVDDNASFETFLVQLRDVDIVGMDCEWKPELGLDKSKLSIMQIATRKQAYILDVSELSRDAYLWKKLNNSLFNNPRILKLGNTYNTDK